MSEFDDFFAFSTPCWLKCRRIGQLFEVVFICAVIDIHLGFDVFSALDAALPLAVVSFSVVMPAERIAAVIARAAIAGI